MFMVQKVLKSKESVSERYSNFLRVQSQSILLSGEHYINKYHGLPLHPV